MPKRSARKSAGNSPQPLPAPLFYPLHALLETIRVIKTYEDPLCTLLHAIQTGATAASGPGEPQVEHELRELLEEMPSAAYVDEMHAVRSLLGTSNTADGKPARAVFKQSPIARKQPAKVASTRKAFKGAKKAGTPKAAGKSRGEARSTTKAAKSTAKSKAR